MKNTTTIDIDLDVYKALVQHSNFIDEPANDVLKRLLNLNTKTVQQSVQSTVKNLTGGLTTKGIFLKNGLKLRKHFKGTLFEATVHDGYIEFNNKKYTSPSGAAVRAAKGSVNGWRFWEFFDEKDGVWKILETLRDK
ncbi:MAG: DUF2924 domain-containing protein [Chitinophagaceae bacterium]|nr:MAG: DUF2924 domain-containing protein [Chitinophagaceae bacterium]